MRNYTPKIFVVVGSPASGKDELIAAVNIIGSLHANIVPKHTDRNQRHDDGNEMICKMNLNESDMLVDNPKYDLNNCDIRYNNYGSWYGIKSSYVWDNLMNGLMQVAVVSNIKALNKIKKIFGSLAVIIYVYSQMTEEDYKEEQIKKAEKKGITGEKQKSEYIDRRVKEFDKAWKVYENNFELFDHVLIYADKEEDLFDQIFRLFRAYETKLI